jgi:cytochrome c-type biogenesis protein CcmH/NrfF
MHSPKECRASLSWFLTDGKTVHQLRPSDVNVVASLGDSITVREPCFCHRRLTLCSTPVLLLLLLLLLLFVSARSQCDPQAAFGAEARNAFQLFNEYRGVSWSGGGVDNYQSVVTMPSALFACMIV